MGDHSPYGTVGHAIRRFPPPRTEERMMTSRHILIDLITIFKSLVAAKRLQEPDRLSQTAKGLSRACAQVQRSSSCACLSADLRSALDTIWRAHYLSETAESATPIGSCHAAPERCQIARGPSRADGSRFHRVNRLGPRSERALVDPEGCVTGSHGPTCPPSRCRCRRHAQSGEPSHADPAWQRKLPDRTTAFARSL
jgi:hypothetical protein